jgi:cytoskeletal protein RodZ
MSAVADQLRQAREARKLTEQELAEVSKIRTDHLRALEEGNFDVFPAPVYIKGFVRTCAMLLKLDVPKVMADLDHELAQTKRFAEPPSLTGEPRGVLDWVMLQFSKVDWRKGVIGLSALVLFVVVVTVVLVWRHQRTADPLANLKPGVFQSTQTVSGDTLPLPGTAPPAKR